MQTFFVILLFLSLLGLIIGLISPKLVIRWGSKRTRGRVFLTYGLAMVVFFILIGVTGHPIKQEKEGPTLAPAPIVEQERPVTVPKVESRETVSQKKCGCKGKILFSLFRIFSRWTC